MEWNATTTQTLPDPQSDSTVSNPKRARRRQKAEYRKAVARRT